MRRSTQADDEGLFYWAGAPLIDSNFSLAPEDEEGTQITIHVQLNPSCNSTDIVPIVTWPSQTDQPTRILDVWQSDSLGYYDNEGYHLRGGCKASDEGNMTIRTILPGHTIENNDSRRRIHFKVWKSVSTTDTGLSIGGYEEELTEMTRRSSNYSTRCLKVESFILTRAKLD